MLNTGDSWIDLVEANTYFNTKWGASFWSSLIDIDKEKLLVTAKNFILDNGYSIADDNTENKVKKAQAECAQFIYESYDKWKKRADLIAGGVKSFSVISFSESLGESSLPVYIAKNLEEYKINQSTVFAEFTRDLNE